MPYRTRLHNLGDKINQDGLKKETVSGERSTIWVWIFLIGAIAPIFAFILFLTSVPSQEQNSRRLNDVENQLRSGLDQIEGDGDGEGLDLFSDTTIDVIDEIKLIIQKINTAKSYNEISGLLRRTTYSEPNSFDLDEWGIKRLTTPFSGFRWTKMTAQISDEPYNRAIEYIKISGRRSDHSQYQAYFVHQDGRVLIDWEATIGWSKVSLDEWLRTKPREEILVRCLVEKQPGYEIRLGGTEYSGYLVSSPNLLPYIVAYIPLNTDRNREIDKNLKAVLNYGSFVSNERPLKDKKVTLKICYKEELGQDGIFEITKFLHDDWLGACDP